jgi:hypothetical protein
VPTTAQDRVSRGPFGALLILLSLLLATGAAAASGSDAREPVPGLGPSRHGAATALLASGARNNSDDDGLATGDGPAAPPSGPSLVTELLWARPLADAPSGDRIALPRPTGASYRARAPPAF